MAAGPRYRNILLNIISSLMGSQASNKLSLDDWENLQKLQSTNNNAKLKNF